MKAVKNAKILEIQAQLAEDVKDLELYNKGLNNTENLTDSMVQPSMLYL